MPDIPVGAQIFDLIFHPTHLTIYTGLLTGEVKAFGYDEEGRHENHFTLRPSKRSCRGLTVNEDGRQLWAVGKEKGLYTIDTGIGEVIETRPGVHESPINRVKYLMPWMLSTGDDGGVIKLWDPRKPECIQSYNQHFDYITDFLWLEDKKQLVATSGDGTLSVIDVRSRKTEPLAQSEDQEDELLSMVAIKGGTKIVVGTQLGILSIFNRRSGWGDCVDRVPGHPYSIDTLCASPSSYTHSNSTILTGSSDGLLRAVQLLPTKLIGIVADHGAFPVERIAVDCGGEGKWVGSAGHDEVLRMTDLKTFFEDENKAGGDVSELETEDRKEKESELKEECSTSTSEFTTLEGLEETNGVDVDGSQEGDSDGHTEPEKKRKRKKHVFIGRKKGRNEVHADASFFAGL